MSNIGVNLVSGNLNSYAKYLPEGAWLRLMLWWYTCQPEQNGAITIPNWDMLRDYPKLLQLRCTPGWSRHNKGRICQLPHPDFWDDFVRYACCAIDVIQPKMVEIMNELDARPDQVDKKLAPFVGCEGKSIAAGLRYARFSKYVAKKLKSLYPELKIVVGALLFQRSWKFILGLWGGRAPKFWDYMSYHQYTYPPYPDIDKVLRKGKRLGKLFNKPVLLTETSVLSDIGGDLHEDRKADYLRRLRSSIHGTCIKQAYWHTLHGGWRNNGLLGEYHPAYDEWLRGFG